MRVDNPKSIDSVWEYHLYSIIEDGVEAAPRGLKTKRIFNRMITFDANYPIIANAVRGLNYRFMVAEAYWILTGDDRVETIAPWNSRIAQFSDDGETFYGAYGPKIYGQMPYIVDTLEQDPWSRQAALNIWRESPPDTKDYPCTLTMVFYHDENRVLHSTVFMRSSDAWLGVPYDTFNFAMILQYVGIAIGSDVGTVNLHMVNAHLYEANWADALEVVHEHRMNSAGLVQIKAPRFDSIEDIFEYLMSVRDTKNKAEAYLKMKELE